MPKIPESRILPKRETDVFKSLVRFYEGKNYKKGVKCADTILKKFPQHGETLAMKGLIMSSMGNKDEAFDLVKKGLRADLTSHVCWHVFGLLHRSNRNYNEAIKCYLNALRHEPENLQVLRDLSSLQVQLRELKGHVETRLKILSLKSNLKQHWIAYAVASDIAGNYKTAVEVIDAFLKTSHNEKIDYEDSELLLYRVDILNREGKVDEALQFLERIKTKVLDLGAWHMNKGVLLLQLERHSEAISIYRTLLQRGPENYDVHRGLQVAVLGLHWDDLTSDLLNAKACNLPSSKLVLSADQRKTLKELYDSIQADYPKSSAAKRIPLTFLQDNELQTQLESYIRVNVKRGVPSIGTDLEGLFMVNESSSHKLKIKVSEPLQLAQHPVMRIICSVCNSIVEESRIQLQHVNESDEKKADIKNTLLWALFLLSRMLEKQGQLKEALELANECISIDPFLVDAYHRKGRVLKKMGAYSAAADIMDDGRKLDLSDRYMNNKTTKYLLRADRVEEAERTIALFTRHEGDPQYYLYEMQCSWYELEWAASQLRQAKFGPCLKKACAVERHFVDFVEDQVDFHTYCIRKMTLRAYVALLNMEDSIYGHVFFRKAAELIIGVYLMVHDKSRLAQELIAEITESSSQTDAKSQSKIGKQSGRSADKTLKYEESKKDNDTSKRGRHGQDIPVDSDPDGEELLAKDPLVEAARVALILSRQAANHVETWVLLFDVAIRNKKHLLALRAVCRGRAISASDPRMLRRTAELYHEVDTNLTKPLSELAQQVLDSERVRLLDGLTPTEYVSSLLTRPGVVDNIAGRIEVVRSILHITGNATLASSTLVDKCLECSGINVESCIDVLRVLSNELRDEEKAVTFKMQCALKYPLATAFISNGSIANGEVLKTNVPE